LTFVFFTSPPASGKSLAFKALNDEQPFWVRVLSVFEANLRKDIDKIPHAAHERLVRLWGLAYLALAFDQKGWVVERRLVTFKMAAAIKYSAIGTESTHNQPDGKRMAGSMPEKVQAGVEEFLGGTLAGQLLGVDAEQWAGYCEFEKGVLNQVFEIIKTCRDFGGRLEKIGDCCEKIRKKAGNTERLHLHLLQSCADTALSDIYEFTSSAILSELEGMATSGTLHHKLAHGDIAANRYLHTPQEQLGGLVLGLHPIGSIVLDSRKAIELLLAHALNPSDQEARERFNAVLITAGSIYDKLIGAPDYDQEITESAYRDPEDPEKDTPLDLAESPVYAPDVVAARNEMHAWVWKVLDQDKELQRDKPVFMDRLFRGLPIAEVAKIHGISAGEVSKRTAAVQKRLYKLAVEQGFFH
jgi:DNA-directed RNA polymerase specialized sigma24 family protein